MTADDQIAELKAALREAILSTYRVSRRTVEYDPAGSTYEIEWTDQVKGWAKLCDLDLEKHEPFWIYP